MLKRKITDALYNWKEDSAHKPLIVKGPRQCGKTFSVLDFAQNNYKHVVYLNFFENPQYKDIFKGSLEIDNLIMFMSAMPGLNVDFEPEKTVIILDEIQECSEARTALKFFHLDGRFDCIATGSLLGVSGYRDNPVSIPVGYETVIEMTPLDFEEFVWASGVSPQVISTVIDCYKEEKPVPLPIHNRMRELLLQYVIVGGMPEVVKTFVDTKQMHRVLQMQRNILASYEDDMIKHATKANKSKIRECFQSIPKQLAKENKKFQYSVIKKGTTASDFAGCLQWIEDAGIIARCHNLSITELPLEGNAINEIFKVYMRDTGLFISMLEDGTQADVLQGNMLAYKGAIFENLMADFLSKAGRKLYYFHKDSGLEIDFVTRYDGECTLVEVKSTTGNAKSLKTVLNHPEKYHVYKAIKFGDYNIGRDGQILTLPLYMGALIWQEVTG